MVFCLSLSMAEVEGAEVAGNARKIVPNSYFQFEIAYMSKATILSIVENMPEQYCPSTQKNSLLLQECEQDFNTE